MLDSALKKMKLVMRAGWGLQLEDGYDTGENRGQERMPSTAATPSNAYWLPVCVCGVGVGGG